MRSHRKVPADQRLETVWRPIGISTLDRRDFLLAAAASVIARHWLAATPAAAQEDLRRSVKFWNYYRTLIGEAEPIQESIDFELPDIWENGNNVPFTITVDSPMTPEDNIKTVHLLSTANPQAAVAAYHFTALSGKAAVKGRMRLARTQDVVVVAERSDGRFLVAERRIEVTIGGCGN